MLGLGTGLTDTQTLTMLGSVYVDRATQAFAIYKICQHSSTGISFAYAGYLNLYWQLAILIVIGMCGMAGFSVVDYRNQREKRRRGRGNGKEELHQSQSVECSGTTTSAASGDQ